MLFAEIQRICSIPPNLVLPWMFMPVKTLVNLYTYNLANLGQAKATFLETGPSAHV
jgi:hypothetical protein